MIRSILVCVSILLSIGPAFALAQERFLGNTAEGWAQLLRNSKDMNQRRSAAFALGKMGRHAFFAVPEMKAAFPKEGNTKVKEALVFALGEICRDNPSLKNDRELEALFHAALKDGDPLVRRSAAFALGCQRSGTDATRLALDAAQDDPMPQVRQNAAWALGQFGVAGLPSLRKALKDADSFVKRDAASSLLQITDGDKVHELVPELIPLCRDGNSEVRRAALNVLVRIVDSTDQAAIPALRWALDDKDLENRRNAALALSNIGGEETAVALPVLLEAALNGDPELRRQSVIAVRNIGPAAKAAVPVLARLLKNDKDQKVREYAALALGGIGRDSESAVPLLVEMIQNREEPRNTRIECAMALSRIGPVPKAIDVVPDLLQVLTDTKQDTKVRERVIWSLRVHAGNLRNMTGPLEAFSKVLKEPLGGENKMMRYDCAYMLGMIWQQQAPDTTLDVLTEYLADTTIKLYDKTTSGVGGKFSEGSSGTTTVKEEGAGDGRIMAVDALKMIGAARYSPRPELMRRLRELAGNNNTFPPLQKKAAALLQAAQ